MLEQVKALLRDEAGLTTVEYALLLALIVVAGIVAWQGLGTTVRTAVNNSASSISNAGTGT